MSEHDDPDLNRRGFLQTGAAATRRPWRPSASAASAAAPRRRRPSSPPHPGQDGVDVTILNQGTWRSPDSLDRLLRLAYASGIRYIDTAKCYGSEPGIAKWLEAMPEVRKEIFLVTKDHPSTPRELIAQLDKRLAAFKTDYVDLFFIHGIGEHGDESLEWPKSKEFKETIEAIKKSGKARFVGFSCHDALKVEYLQAAAEGGFVDAIMVAVHPLARQGRALNRALDACHKAGIGLISMKQVAGNSRPDPQGSAQARPDLDREGAHPPTRGCSTRSGPTSGSRRPASRCGTPTRSARTRRRPAVFEPLKQAEIDQLRDAFLAAGPTFCANCDGSCSRAAGHRGRARRPDPAAHLPRPVRLPRRGPPALRRACPTRPATGKAPTSRPPAGLPDRLDFASLLPRSTATSPDSPRPEARGLESTGVGTMMPFGVRVAACPRPAIDRPQCGACDLSPSPGERSRPATSRRDDP